MLRPEMEEARPGASGDEARGEVRAAKVELEERLSRLGVDAGALVPGRRGTILDPTFEVPGDEAEPPLSPMAQLAPAGGQVSPGGALLSSASDQPSLVSGGDVDPQLLALGPVVGTGGMGVVNLATQPSLRREVVVKRVRPEKKTRGAVNALMREAWVTGALEHPNVVPVHMLLVEDGLPSVVMKRIEGVTWDTLLTAPELLAELGRGAPGRAASDRQNQHLRILIEVCRAIELAHARGVLHLDLKPDNVMVGRFGEVYVVDWGIAASLPGGPSWLPPAAAIRTVRGTPAWMPPELATADAAHIDERSDVYLLGGLLHAILTEGEPRHRGGAMIDMLATAYLSLPQRYPDAVPAELAELANRATHRDPQRRPASAEAFRRAIEDYLEHRHSMEIAQRATVKKDSLVGFFTRTRQGPAETTQAGQELRRNFLECRFAFRQALEIWPGNTRARDGLRELLAAMARYALANEQLERAAECVAELAPRDPALEAEVKALSRTLAERHERLLTLERDASIELYREKRSALALLIGLGFIVWNVTTGLVHRSGLLELALGDLLVFNALTFIVFSFIAWLVRDTLLSAATNRRLVLLFGTGFIAVLCFWLAAWVHGQVHPERALSALEVVALSNWAYPFFVLAVTFTADVRAAWIAPVVTALAVVAPLTGDFAFEILGLEGFIVGAWLSFVWRNRSTPPAAPAA